MPPLSALERFCWHFSFVSLLLYCVRASLLPVMFSFAFALVFVAAPDLALSHSHLLFQEASFAMT